MNLQANASLLTFNTFGINAKSKYFVTFNGEKNLQYLLQTPLVNENEKLILGGGSNVLFTKNFEGIVLKNDIKGIQIIQETPEHVLVQAGAGENWHKFVLYCIKNGYAGVENLSLIPGNVGASPMQNIGAYGVEIKDVFHSLQAVEIKTGKTWTFNNEDCGFGYRESVFKNRYKNEFVITSVTYKLSKKPSFNISYGAIKQELEKMKVQELSIEKISQAVINIRQAKLPDPKEIGNAGSFFKNPVVTSQQFEELKHQYPKVSHYPLPNGSVKLAAGWLIDTLGWKGKRINNYGVHKNQALVLVNYGGAAGVDIFNLSEKIIEDVKLHFGITLQREVNIY